MRYMIPDIRSTTRHLLKNLLTCSGAPWKLISLITCFQMHHVYSVVYLSNLYVMMSIFLYNRELIFAVSFYLPGNFGVVHKGVLKTDGNVVDVAVKTIKSEMFVCIVLRWVWIWIDISWLYLWYKRYAQLKCLVWSALNIAVNENWHLTSNKSLVTSSFHNY